MTMENDLHMASPLDDDNLLSEIFLRLPPLPSSLPRVSLVCRRWRRLAGEKSLRRRFRARHSGQAPLLGVYTYGTAWLEFRPLMDRIPSERLRLWAGGHGRDQDTVIWSMHGCRGGLLLSEHRNRRKIAVCDPIIRELHLLDLPPDFHVRMEGRRFVDGTAGAVLPAPAGGGQEEPRHFRLVFVHSYSREHRAVARVYSSDTDTWGDPVSVFDPAIGFIPGFPGVLVGDTLYWWQHNPTVPLIQFDLGTQSLAVITDIPSFPANAQCQVIRGEHGGLGLAVLSYPNLELWDRKHGWVRRKVLPLKEVLDLDLQSRRWCSGMMSILAYAEDAHAIFLSLRDVAYMLHLDESLKSTRLWDSYTTDHYHPFASVYTRS